MTDNNHADQLAAYFRLRSKFGPDHLSWPLEEIEAEGLRVNRDAFLKARAKQVNGDGPPD